MKRRQFLHHASAFATTALVASSTWRSAFAAIVDEPARGGPGPYGRLMSPDENGIRLPEGFRSRVIARAGRSVPGTRYPWHDLPDGGAVFAAPDGWIYVSNSETYGGIGASAIRFDSGGDVVDAYSILTGTDRNCSGGATPWDTWLSCEEVKRGLVWECDPYGDTAARACPALGSFRHEAVAADPVGHRMYLTEDHKHGGFYRFTPDVWGDLDSGRLEIAEVRRNGRVRWHPVPDPNPRRGDTPTRKQVKKRTSFDGGEGILYADGVVHFTTKGDDRVWSYLPEGRRLCVLYDGRKDPKRRLQGGDNLAISPTGDLVVAEDGEQQELVVITEGAVASPLLRVLEQPDSELTGPAFDPSGTRLYFSSQRGEGDGITYEVSGDFRRST